MVESCHANNVQSNLGHLTTADHFPMENIPFGVFFNKQANAAHCCTRIGSKLIDLCVIEHERLFNGPLFSVLDHHVFCESTLNKFMELGPTYRVEARETIQKLFAFDSPQLNEDLKAKAIFEANEQ